MRSADIYQWEPVQVRDDRVNSQETFYKTHCNLLCYLVLHCRRCYQQALQEFPEYFPGVEATSDYSSDKSVRGCVNVAQGLVS